MEYCLVANGLTKTYRNFKALDNFNMTIKKGSIYGLIGKNGSGKTTLIRLLCGLQSATSGHFSFFGVSSEKTKDILKERRRMGAIVETPSIYLDMTAKQNLQQQYDILGLPNYNGLEDILKYVGLFDVTKKKAKDFSLGMRQRLGLALVLVGNPDFVILDEPINGLDPQGIVEIRELILKLNHDKGITFLISSHILGELSKLATHYGFIDKGKMLKEISANDLERSCKKKVVLTVSSVKPLLKYLDNEKIEYNIVSLTEIEVFDNINITAIVEKLSESNEQLIKVVEKDEDLESYYINLLGGNVL